MSTAAEIIEQAFREGNFTAIGEAVTAPEIAEALPRLNNYIQALFGFEIGTPLVDFYVPSERTVEYPIRRPFTPDGSAATVTDSDAWPLVNVRLLVGITSPKTLYFPADPRDGSRIAYVDIGSTATLTLDGNGRLIEGETSLEGVPADPEAIPATLAGFAGKTWFYRSDLADWRLIEQIEEEEDEMPFPPEFDDLLITGLAIRMSLRMGVKDIGNAILARNSEMLTKLRLRYKHSEEMPVAPEFTRYPTIPRRFMEI